LQGDPALCGLALYETPFYLLPGRDRLVGRSPLYAFHPADPAAGGDLAAAARKAAPAFNRILARREQASDLRLGFSQRDRRGAVHPSHHLSPATQNCPAGPSPKGRQRRLKSLQQRST